MVQDNAGELLLGLLKGRFQHRRLVAGNEAAFAVDDANGSAITCGYGERHASPRWVLGD